MGTKTISLDDEAYERLKMQKIGGESFSEVVKRITSPSPKKSIMEFSGIWKLNKREIEAMKSRLGELEGDFDDMFRH